MYNRVNCAQKEFLVLNSYVPGMNASIVPKRNYEDIFSEKLVYELHAWIENHSHVIYSANVSDSLFMRCSVLIRRSDQDRTSLLS